MYKAAKTALGSNVSTNRNTVGGSSPQRYEGFYNLANGARNDKASNSVRTHDRLCCTVSTKGGHCCSALRNRRKASATVGSNVVTVGIRQPRNGRGKGREIWCSLTAPKNRPVRNNSTRKGSAVTT